MTKKNLLKSASGLAMQGSFLAFAILLTACTIQPGNETANTSSIVEEISVVPQVPV